MNKWILIHSYQKLAEEGKVGRVECPDCFGPVVSMIDAVDTNNDDPVLWCPSCDSRSKPGIAFWDQVEATVRDYYEL